MENPDTVLAAAGRVLALLERAGCRGGLLHATSARLARGIALRAAHLRRLVARAEALAAGRSRRVPEGGRVVRSRPVARWLDARGASYVLGADGRLLLRPHPAGEYACHAAGQTPESALALIVAAGVPFRRVAVPSPQCDRAYPPPSPPPPGGSTDDQP